MIEVFPRLVTITAPTASGKSYLLDALVDNGTCTKIISTTTRQKRPGEVEGKDYYFLDSSTSKRMEENGEFAEVVKINGATYGTTIDEIKYKLSLSKPAVIIVDPHGIYQYRELATKNNWNIMHAFIFTKFMIRRDRLISRVMNAVYNQSKDVIVNELAKGFSRFEFSITEERAWISAIDWDAILPGDDLELAVQIFKEKFATY